MRWRKWWADIGTDTTCSAGGNFRNGYAYLASASDLGTGFVSLTRRLDATVPEKLSWYIGDDTKRRIGTTPLTCNFSISVTAVSSAAVNLRIEEGDGSCGLFETGSTSSNFNSVAVHTGTVTADKDAQGHEEAPLLTSIDQGAHGSRYVDIDVGDNFATWVELPHRRTNVSA